MRDFDQNDFIEETINFNTVNEGDIMYDEREFYSDQDDALPDSENENEEENEENELMTTVENPDDQETRYVDLQSERWDYWF